MKLRTHYVFSTGLLTLFTYFLYPALITPIVAGLISIIGNLTIDKLGHEIRGKYISRTPRTHTLPRSIGWGILLSLPFVITLFFLNFNFIIGIIDGFLVGPSHMLLDVFTERGIYIRKNKRWTRFALAHFRYDNLVINSLAIFIGIVMLYVALSI
ncbi:hypothetical protein CM19_11190 [Candidatus Acidianus copahuensis]|uniref:Uncharacterized protein n=1 Tax=Candidatus Acidianus copahuensis TaxID=1160895 RepID=A0A031LLB6_9CREN|nr:DUF1286 domain-containing protein [Candidatus Acidianus copahuensis]EZQ02029.1 hypothetical protein CM19_11190 [Candidatus Acidianus copahuensis]